RHVRPGLLDGLPQAPGIGPRSTRNQAPIPPPARRRHLLRLGAEGPAGSPRNSALARPDRSPLLSGTELRTLPPHPGGGYREAFSRTFPRVAGRLNPNRPLL